MVIVGRPADQVLRSRFVAGSGTEELSQGLRRPRGGVRELPPLSRRSFDAHSDAMSEADKRSPVGKKRRRARDAKGSGMVADGFRVLSRHRPPVCRMRVAPAGVEAACAVVEAGGSRRLAAAAANETAGDEQAGACAGQEPGCWASGASKTARIRTPPTCRLMLNTPLATPVRWSGAAPSSSVVTGSITRGPAGPTGTMRKGTAHTGVEVLRLGGPRRP